MKKLAITFIAASIIDIALTWLLLNSGGAEANPILRSVISHGWGIAVLWKVLIPISTAAILILLNRRTMLRLLTTGMIAICIWNCCGLAITYGII